MLKLLIGISLLTLVGVNGSYAFSIKDSGWIDYGKTARTRQFTQRRIDINSSKMGTTGLIYIYKKGEATRGEKYPYLPFGLTTFQKNWRMSGLFDLKLNGKKQYLYKYLSAPPKFEYIQKTFEAITLKIGFPCGADGQINLIVHISKEKNYFDFTFDFSEFKTPIKDLSIIFNSLPSHNGIVKKAEKKVKVPFNRIFRTVARTIKHQANGVVKLAPNENWVILYDKEFGAGSCAIMFDPKVVNSFSLNGNRMITLSAKIKSGSKKVRFFIWEFPRAKQSLEGAYQFMVDNTNKLLKTLRRSSKKSQGNSLFQSYKAIQTNAPPVIDGKSNDKVWNIAPWSGYFYDLKTGEKASEQTKFKVIYDAKNLYLLIHCDSKYPAEIIANERIHDSNKIFRDDSIEIFLSPQNSAANYFHMAFNSLGTTWDAIVLHKKHKLNKAWNPQWEVATYCDETGWTAEVKIPFMSMLLTREVDDHWMLNITRNNQTGKGRSGYQKYSTWSKLDGKFDEPDKFNELVGINEDLHYALQEKKFRAYGMQAIKRRKGVRDGIEVVSKGSENAYLYYPTKELYLPANGTVLRSLFEFKESRNARRDLWRLRKGKTATEKYLKSLSFHFMLPKGVTVATQQTSSRMALFNVEHRSDRHIVLHPLLPSKYGELWNSVVLNTIPIFLKHNLDVGDRVPIDSWVEYSSPTEKSCVIRSYINIVKFPWVKKSSENLSIASIWSFYFDVVNFPNYVTTVKASGFTGVPIFAGDLLYDGGQNNRNYDKDIVNKKRNFLIKLAKQARHAGLKVYLNDTTFNKVGFNKDTQWGRMVTGFPLGNPGYRGPLYESDINDVVTAYKMLDGADRISMDIECFKRVTEKRFGYFAKGGADTVKVKKMAQERGVTVEEIFTDYGTEMIRDVKSAIHRANRELGIKKAPKLLVWNMSADETNPMEGLFDYKKLYPQYSELFNPQVYFESDPRKIGNRIKRHRRIIGNNDIIACLTMRSKRNDLNYTELRDQILECFYNGAGGINYWPMAFDQNDVYGQLLALREVLPFEELLVNGKFISLTQDANPTQIVGFIYNSQAILLVSNYREGAKKVKVVNPLKQPAEVNNISTGKALGTVKPDSAVTITLNKRRTAVIKFNSLQGN